MFASRPNHPKVKQGLFKRQANKARHDRPDFLNDVTFDNVKVPCLTHSLAVKCPFAGCPDLGAGPAGGYKTKDDDVARKW